VVDDDLLALERRPTEGLVGLASREKEAIPLIDLGEMDGGRSFAVLERAEGLRGADWQTWTDPSARLAMADLPGAETECLGAKPSCCRKPPAKVAMSGE
jgi:hypothetical protein